MTNLFKCFSNFIVILKDTDILDLVDLHVIHEFKFKEENSPVSIIIKFSYKSMTTIVGSIALCTGPKCERMKLNFWSHDIFPTYKTMNREY